MHSEWVHAEKRRYYTVQMLQDLLGEWVVVQRWGSLLSRQGGHKQVLCASRTDAEIMVTAIARRRQCRRYQYVFPG